MSERMVQKWISVCASRRKLVLVVMLLVRESGQKRDGESPKAADMAMGNGLPAAATVRSRPGLLSMKIAPAVIVSRQAWLGKAGGRAAWRNELPSLLDWPR